MMGGGGHYDMAGATLHGTTLEDACKRLKACIDSYLDNPNATGVEETK